MQPHVSYTLPLITQPTVLVPLSNFFKFRNAGLCGTPVRYWNAIRYQAEMLDAGIPMPAASASMPMPSYANYKCLLRSQILSHIRQEWHSVTKSQEPETTKFFCSSSACQVPQVL
jgi:hypothetical protein